MLPILIKKNNLLLGKLSLIELQYSQIYEIFAGKLLKRTQPSSVAIYAKKSLQLEFDHLANCTDFLWIYEV